MSNHSLTLESKGPRTLQLKLQKNRYHPYTLQLFFTTATIFATVLYMGNDFHNDFFGKIVKIIVVYDGLKRIIGYCLKVTHCVQSIGEG